jgi:predicted nucleotidyltransferase
MASPSCDDRSVREIVATTLSDHPISVGFLFGSRARNEAHDRSDVDVAVVFEDTEPGDPGHVNARLALGADLALALGTDDVDVVDLRSASPSLVRAVFRDGDRLVGTADDERRLREALLDDGDTDPRSPAERFDDALAAIDDHLA